MPSAASYNIDDYESLQVSLQHVLGVVVPEAKRKQLVNRLQPVLSSFGLDSLASLAEALQAGQADTLRSRVLDVLSQRQPDWSVSPEIKNVLHNYVFEQLPENARIWVVGCGQGQLAYAIAMELAEYEEKHDDAGKVQITATDNLSGDIKQAELAIYDSQQMDGLSEEYIKKYTSLHDGDSWQIKDKIRQRVSFSQCDLMADFQSMAPLDLIICPDVLVYFSNGVKAGILKQFSSVLKSGGILLSGTNQAVIPFSQGFERVNHPAGVFYRQKS